MSIDAASLSLPLKIKDGATVNKIYGQTLKSFSNKIFVIYTFIYEV